MKQHSASGSYSEGRHYPTIRPLAYACMLAMGLGTTAALAQDAPGSTEEVVVTGSRIQNTSGFNTPTPVTVITGAELDLMAPGNMIDALSQLPIYYNNTSSYDPGNFFSSPGTGNLNLRGIGTKRTLVLLDGRRVVSSTRFGGTDISVFPENLVREVQTVTGGASAAYGTDAITGVTNFILDTDFEGIRGHAQSGQTGHGDGDNWEASFAFGTELGDRGHLLFSADHFDQDGIHTYDGRDWYQNWGTIKNQDANGPTDLIRRNVVSTTATFTGLISAPGTPLHNLNFNSEGTAATPFVFTNGVASPGNPSQSIAGNNGDGDDFGADTPNLLRDFQRENLFLRFDFDVGDNVTLFAQGMRGESFRSELSGGGQFQFVFSPMRIYSGNAFLPASIQQVMDDNDIESFTLNRMGHSSDLKRGGAGLALNSTFTSQTLGIEVDFSGGGFFDGWGLDGFIQSGESKTQSRQSGGIRLDRIHMAHDAVIDPATGATVCNVTLVSGLFPDCVPLNPFGIGNMSDEAIDWVTGFEPGQSIETPIYYAKGGTELGVIDQYVTEEAKVTRSTIEQDVFEIAMSGEVFDNRSAGPIGVAFGGGWREEKMDQIVRVPVGPYFAPDGTQLSTGILDGNHDAGRPVPINYAPAGIRGNSGGDINNSVAIQYSKIPNVVGSKDVSEIFGEILVPVLADNRLNIPLAYRYADYSGSGGISVFKAGIHAQITESVRLRATRSHDVRAGTLSERFDQTGGIASVEDPLRGGEQFSIFRTSGGNPNIRPEESDTITAGIVWEPTGSPGLQMSLDWFEVDLTDAIAELGPQDIVDQCYIAGDVSLCPLIVRQPDESDGTPGVINLVSANYLNIDKAAVSGTDFEIRYRRDVNWLGGGEQISMRLLSTHLTENSTTGFQADKIDRAGQVGGLFPYPSDKVTANFAYARGSFSAFLQARWIDKGVRDILDVEGVDIDDNSVSSITYVDLNGRYQMDVASGVLTLYGNVQNLLDRDPPRVVSNFSIFGGESGAQTQTALYDMLGRRYTFGVRYSF
jgi:iron complex outermembrane receptor protein